MSAYICDTETWKTVLKGFTKYGDLRTTQDNLDDMWRKIVQLNYDSVNYRYNENARPDFEVFKAPTELEMWRYQPTDVEIFEAIQEYTYQSCELPDYHHYEAYYRCDWVKTAMLRKLLGTD